MRVFLLLTAMILSASLASADETVIGMNQQILGVLEDAQSQLDAGELVEAETSLQRLLERRLSGYERAQALNMLGFLYWQTEQWQLAEAAYGEALAQKRLPTSLIASLTATMARLALVQHEYDLAEERFLSLLKLPDQDTAEHRMLLANVYVGMQRWQLALKAAQTGLAKQSASGREPLESWLSLLASIHFSLEDYSAMRDVLRDLVAKWPREQHLMNLAAIYGQLGDAKRQLALVEAMLDHGAVVREQNLLVLAGLFMSEGLPYKAATLLERAMDTGQIKADAENLRRQSQAWYLAGHHDKAIPPLEQAAEIGADGSLYISAARLYLNNYQFAAAEKAAAKALRFDDLDERGTAWLLRGMAAVYLKQFDAAQAHFEAALSHEDSVQSAEQWLQYTNHERARLADVAED